MLCVVFDIFVMPWNLQAQNSTDSLNIINYTLGSVVVTASRTPVEAQQATRMVTTITRSDIAKAPVRNLNDLLRHVAGVDIRQRGPLGTQADISIRGGTYDQTLILLNGVNVTDPQTGHNNLNLPIDVESIDRIEILQGPSAKSFGPNAFNGVINIITGNSYQNHIRTSLTLGQYGFSKASANISNTTGHFEQFISISRTSSDGYIKNTDFSNTTIFYQAKCSLKPGTIDLQTGYGIKDFGANGFYSLKYPEQFESIKTEFVSLKYQSNSKIKFVPVLYLRRNRDRFELKRDNDSIPFNHHQTITAGLNLNIWTIHRFGRSSLGIDIRNEHILSNVLGNLLTEPVGIPGFRNAFYSKYYNRINTSLYAEHTFYWNMLTATVGIMAHHNSDINGFGFYPGADVSYRLNDHFKLFSSINKTLRMPTFTDMFYKSPVQQGNPRLKPEEAFTAEAGLKFSDTFFKGNISAFRSKGRNMIDWVKNPSPDSIIWRSMNHAKINFTGIECSLTLIPPAESIFGHVQSVTISWAFLKADSIHSDLLSKYALDYLNNQFNASIDFRIAAKLYNSTRITCHDRNSVYQDAKGQIVTYKPYLLSDSKLYWKEKNCTLYVEASNICNTRYYDYGGLIQSGIWIMAGIEGDLDYKSKNGRVNRK
jgi:vitamin B12 transporter